MIYEHSLRGEQAVSAHGADGAPWGLGWRSGLWDCSPGHDPLHGLPGDVRDEVVVGVVMQDGDCSESRG